MEIEEYKFDHFKNIDEVMYYFNYWYKEEDIYSMNRYLSLKDFNYISNKYQGLQKENKELKEQLHDASIQIQELIEQDIECPSNCEKLEKLQQENKKQQEVIDKIMNLIKQYGKHDGKKCTRGFQMWSADFNKILDILKEVE
jgi:hypothetical protein